MLDQFELALHNGLHGRLSPMVIQQRRTASRPTPPAHTMDGSDSRNNRSLRSIESDNHEDHTYLRSLLERMASPDEYAMPITPTPSVSTPCFSCTICNLTQAYIDHDTPDCRQYICFICGTKKPGHWPEDCPKRLTTVIPPTMLD